MIVQFAFEKIFSNFSEQFGARHFWLLVILLICATIQFLLLKNCQRGWLLSAILLGFIAFGELSLLIFEAVPPDWGFAIILSFFSFFWTMGTSLLFLFLGTSFGLCVFYLIRFFKWLKSRQNKEKIK